MTDDPAREELIAVPRLRLEKLEAEVAALTAFVASFEDFEEIEEQPAADPIAEGFLRFRMKRKERNG